MNGPGPCGDEDCECHDYNDVLPDAGADNWRFDDGSWMRDLDKCTCADPSDVVCSSCIARSVRKLGDTYKNNWGSPVWRPPTRRTHKEFRLARPTRMPMRMPSTHNHAEKNDERIIFKREGKNMKITAVRYERLAARVENKYENERICAEASVEKGEEASDVLAALKSWVCEKLQIEEIDETELQQLKERVARAERRRGY